MAKTWPADGEPDYEEWEFEKCRKCGVHLAPDEGPTVAIPENVKRPARGVTIAQFACYHERCAPAK